MKKRILSSFLALLMIVSALISLTVAPVSAATASGVPHISVKYDSTNSSTNGRTNFKINGGNPARAYKLTMDYYIYGTVADTTAGSQFIEINFGAAGSDSNYLGYRYGDTSFYLKVAGVTTTKSYSLVDNQYYRFEILVSDTKFALSVNGFEVLSREVSHSQYGGLVFNPKNIIMDVLCTKFEYLDGTANVFISGREAMAKPYWTNPNYDWENSISYTVTYSIRKMIAYGDSLCALTACSNVKKVAGTQVFPNNNNNTGIQHSRVYLDTDTTTNFAASVSFVTPASINNTDKAYIGLMQDGVAAGYRYRDNKLFIASYVHAAGSNTDGIFRDDADTDNDPAGTTVLSSKNYTLEPNQIYELTVKFNPTSVVVYLNGERVLSTTSDKPPVYNSGNHRGLSLFCPGMSGTIYLDYRVNGNKTQNSLSVPFSEKTTNRGGTWTEVSNVTIGGALSFADAKSACDTARKSLSSEYNERTTTTEALAVYTEYVAINNLASSINAIPASPTLENSAAITAAQTSYNALADNFFGTGAERKAKVDALTSTTLAVKRAVYNALVPTAAMSGTPDSSKITANLYFTIPNSELTGDKKDEFTITFGDEDYDLDDTAVTEVVGESSTNYILHLSVAARKMTLPVHYSISAYGTTYREGDMTVKYYCEQLIAGDYDTSVKNVAQAMLVYGGCAQRYFGYRSDDQASSTLPSAEGAELGERFNGTPLKNQLDNTANCPITYSAINVTFLEDTTLMMAFYVHNYSNATEAINWIVENVTFGGYTPNAEDSPVTVYASGGTHVVLQIQNVPIVNVLDSIALVVDGQNYSLSVLNYIAAAQSSSKANLPNLTLALYRYAVATVSYAASVSVGDIPEDPHMGGWLS